MGGEKEKGGRCVKGVVYKKKEVERRKQR